MLLVATTAAMHAVISIPETYVDWLGRHAESGRTYCWTLLATHVCLRTEFSRWAFHRSQGRIGRTSTRAPSRFAHSSG